MDSSDSKEDSYQKDSLLDLLSKGQKNRVNDIGRFSIDFTNQVMTKGMYKQSKQIYIQNTCHTKEIHVSMIKDQRSKSLINMIILSRNANLISASMRRISVDPKLVDKSNLEAEAIVERVQNTVRRKSCHCSYCGQQGEFEKRMNTFQARTEQAINTDLRLLKYNSRNPHKQQTLIRFHKIKQLQAKYHVSNISTQMENQVQAEFNYTPMSMAMPVTRNKSDSRKKMIQQPVVLKQFLSTSKNYFLKQFLIGQKLQNTLPKQITLPSLKILSQSRRDLFGNRQY